MIKFTNAAGNVVQTNRVVLKPGMNNIPMTLNSYASGMYYVSMVLSGDNSVQTTTLIKHR